MVAMGFYVAPHRLRRLALVATLAALSRRMDIPSPPALFFGNVACATAMPKKG